MKVNGIIAEYNPFHNGHLYQLQESARLTESDYTVIVMSGNFVQRGAPALADKRVRTEAALRCGADLILELPVLYAAASAEFFAAGAVALLDRLGVVTHLCFGSECGDGEKLGEIAGILSEEPPPYRAALKASLRQGCPYPAARAQALNASLHSGTYPDAHPELSGDLECIVSSPNNILGIEYIRALRRRSSAILPVTVRRLGAGYHDAGLPEDIPSPGNACSALALRQAMYQGESLVQLAAHMPREASAVLAEYLNAQKPLRPDDFSSVLYYRLMMEEMHSMEEEHMEEGHSMEKRHSRKKAAGYEKYLDMSPELSDRIRNQLRFYTGFESFCDVLKTKNMTYTRISRCLLHILLGIEKDDMELGKKLDYTPYARVLGFRRSAAPLLGAVKEHADIPLVTSVPDARKSLSAEANRLLELDIFASRLYREIARADSRHPPLNEISTSPIIL